jgi:acylpyruvate hydrolase
MRFARITTGTDARLAVQGTDGTYALAAADGGNLDALVAAGTNALTAAGANILSNGALLAPGSFKFLPPLVKAPKIICLGLNYVDHAAEGGFEPPPFPTLFARFGTSLIGHDAPIIRPKISTALDYEGELVAVIGTGGKNITLENALHHVIGYSIFNDGSIRDYQRKTPQWTAGKNFDNTGAFGPWFITADELPPGAAGLKLETRLNGKVMQQASTSDMIFDVATTVSLLSTFLTLEPGDVLVMGTPAGVGAARTPPVFMKHGDIVEIEIEKLGILSNPVVDE